jgi:hypothetical protein
MRNLLILTALSHPVLRLLAQFCVMPLTYDGGVPHKFRFFNILKWPAACFF